jgi:uncharacterized protein
MYAEDWAEWHEAHEERRARPHGFLAATGLHWLTPEWQTFEDVPGEWREGPDGVMLRRGSSDQIVDGNLMLGDVLAEVGTRPRA